MRLSFPWRKWFGKRTTLLVVPEANRSVLRLGVPHYLLVMLGAAVVAALAGGTVIYTNGLQSFHKAERLEAELEGQKRRYESALSRKEQTIGELQSGLLELTQQAEEIKHKMESLQKLENELNGITRAGNKPPATASILSAEERPAAADAVGGPMLPPTESETKALMSDTIDEFGSMAGEMGALIESLSVAKATLLEKQHEYNITPNLWPSDGRIITSGFGLRIDPFTRRLSMHDGLDISGRTGDEVIATAEGTIVEAGFDRTRGNYIEIKHPQGIRTIYMHLSKILVQEGDYVAKEQTIGRVGSTGRSTGPHVHYQITVNGKLVNPKSYLPE